MSDNKLYDILGVQRSASEFEIKRAYHKLAKEHHPDKNPDHGDKFKEISYAYDVLADSKKRAVYDRYGLKGLKEGSGGDPFSAFSGAEGIFADLFGGGGGGGIPGMFFGGGGGGRSRRERRGDNTMKPLMVTLEDLYNGKTFKKTIERKALCSDCEGTGSKNAKASRTCADCRGAGMKIQYRQLGPGLVQQVQSACPKCEGQGTVIPDKDKCKGCGGSKIKTETREIDVEVAKGMTHGTKIVLENMGDEEPGVITGDWIYVVQQTPHSLFERSNENLIMNRTISLTEALCGFQFLIEQLDGRTLVVNRAPGQVVPADAIQLIEGEGMPQFKNPYLKGNLLIKIKVEFPQNHFADEKTLKALEALLPARTPFEMPIGDHVEEVDLDDYEDMSGNSAVHESDDEDDGPHGGQRVGCTQQ